jgi:hypothetical protein
MYTITFAFAAQASTMPTLEELHAVPWFGRVRHWLLGMQGQPLGLVGQFWLGTVWPFVLATATNARRPENAETKQDRARPLLDKIVISNS